MAVEREDTARVRIPLVNHIFEHIRSSQTGAIRHSFVAMNSKSQDIGEQDWRWCDADAYMHALACALPRFDHRLGGSWLAAGAVHPYPIALRWLGYTFCESLLAIDAHYEKAQYEWMASMMLQVGSPDRDIIRRRLYHSTSACSDNSPLPIPFGRWVHLLSRTPARISSQGKAQGKRQTATSLPSSITP